MGLSDFLFGKKKEIKPKILQEPYQIAGRKGLYEAAEPGALGRLGRAGEPYPGELTAPLSKPEEMGLEGLEKYLKSAMPTEGGLYGMAKGELEKTLGGEEYDPIEGAYYQAYRTQVMRELQEAKDRLAAKTSARDKYFGGGRIAATGELEETATGDLALVLGQLFEAERERKLGAVDPAMRMTAFEEMSPLQRVEASQQFGALPREVEQAGLDREKQEWIRQMTDLGIPLQTAMQLAMYRPEYYYPSYQATPGILGGETGISQAPGGQTSPQKAMSIANAIAQIFAMRGGG